MRFVAAANPVEQNSGAWDLSAPLANRFAHLDWPLRLTEWRCGYLDGWPALAPLDIDLSAVSEDTDRGVIADSRPSSSPAGRSCSATCPTPRRRRGDGPHHGHGSDSRTAAAVAETAASRRRRRGAYRRLAGGRRRSSRVLGLATRTPTCPTPSICWKTPPDSRSSNAETSSSRWSTPSPRWPSRNPEHWQDAFRVCIAAAENGAADIAVTAATRLVEHKPPKTRLPAGYEASARSSPQPACSPTPAVATAPQRTAAKNERPRRHQPPRRRPPQRPAQPGPAPGRPHRHSRHCRHSSRQRRRGGCGLGAPAPQQPPVQPGCAAPSCKRRGCGWRRTGPTTVRRCSRARSSRCSRVRP